MKVVDSMSKECHPPKKRGCTTKSGSFRLQDTRPPQSGRDFPIDRASLELMFGSERACVGFVESLRHPRGFICPACESRQPPWRSPVGSAMLACSDCRRPLNLLQDTPFFGTRVPLARWFSTLWHWIDEPSGLTDRALAEHLGLADVAEARRMLDEVRRGLRCEASERLAGEVRLSTAKVALEPGAKPASMIVAVEQAGKDARMQVSPLARNNASEILRFVADNVAPGTLVVTPPWRGLGALRQMGYFHTMRPSQHGVGGLDPIEVTAELRLWLWSLPSPVGDLALTLDEFALRFNERRNGSGRCWYHVVRQAIRDAGVDEPELLGAVG
jgi:Transposase zinc-ribbon domain